LQKHEEYSTVFVVVCVHSKPIRIGALIHWRAPSDRWVTLNYDGSVRSIDGMASCVGLVHDSWGG